MNDKVTPPRILKKKKKKDRITALTAHNFPVAALLDEAGIDIILVGDSLAMVALGYESTLPVTMDEMVHHTKAVSRAVKRALVVADMPYESYHISIEQTLTNAFRFIKAGGAEAVKIEGGQKRVRTIEALVGAEIPVMGHVGLTPQSVNVFGGFKVQGKTIEAACRLMDDALAVQEAGAFSIVLEGIPHQVSALMTERLAIPTIGIGAGPDCDGQILVTDDIFGTFKPFAPKFVRRYGDIYDVMSKGCEQYIEDVKSGGFPSEDESYGLDSDHWQGIKERFEAEYGAD
jgi:3-methyl-2-oxobutanoate hydroxymethyltransferase